MSEQARSGHRAVMERLLDELYGHPGIEPNYDDEGDYLCGCEAPHYRVEQMARRLAVESDGLPLDVERLAEAIGNTWLPHGEAKSLNYIANEIASEYARLTKAVGS